MRGIRFVLASLLTCGLLITPASAKKTPKEIAIDTLTEGLKQCDSGVNKNCRVEICSLIETFKRISDEEFSKLEEKERLVTTLSAYARTVALVCTPKET